VEGYVRTWKTLNGRVDDRRYAEILAQLEYQAGQAEVWRDAVSNWFLRESGIPDAKGRVGRYPGRFEAESLMLEGYREIEVTPWEGASGGKAVECGTGPCSAAFRFNGTPGRYTIRVQYFDLSDFRVSVGDRVVDEWAASGRSPSRKIDGSSSTRRVIPGVALRTGDEIRIAGGALDYVELVPYSAAP
jgi:alpha-glucuronidase